jgi:ribosome maturation factor RimP
LHPLSESMDEGTISPLFYLPLSSMDKVQQLITDTIAPALQEKDLFLVDIKVLLGGKKIEVYADSQEGIGIDDCAVLSRMIEKVLDGNTIVPDNYLLEVSSPGMTNPLKVPQQYKRRIGSVLEIATTDGRNIEAKLLEASEDSILLEEVKAEKKVAKKGAKAPVVKEELKKFELKYSDIKKAVVQFKF